MRKKIGVDLRPSRWTLSQNYGGRITALCLALSAGTLLLVARYAYLSFLPNDLRDRLRTQATRQFETEITLAPPRGQIFDREGRPLAVSVLTPSLFLVPKRIPESAAEREKLARQIDLPVRQLESLAKSRKGFAWVRRQMTPAQFEALGDLSPWHACVGIIEEPKRLYPERELAAHLIGFVGVDDHGLDGVEALYNHELKGASVQATVTRDARGRTTLVTPNGAVRPEPVTQPLRLSIDLALQTLAEGALKEGVVKARARGGSLVIQDVRTGELLAIASYPTYDLNAPPTRDRDKVRFRAVNDALELGSVVKPLFIAKALDRGDIRATDLFDCEKGNMAIPGGRIHDDHPRGLLSPAEIIKVSSNICTYKIVQKMGRDAFRESIIQSGLGRWAGTGLPGEWQGRISSPETWREMRFANMTFGQGLAISPLQMTRALSMLTGGGRDPGVRLLAVSEGEAPEHAEPPAQFISAETSRRVTRMMTGVVEEDGTGKLAAVPGLSVAGKTGTAEKYMPATKSYSERTSSFTGVIPAETPRLAITVVIDEPQVRPAYGGLLAGPVFSKVALHAMRYLNARGMVSFEPSDRMASKDDHAHDD